MPANDIKKSMFGHRKFPRLSLVSIPVPLALEASALTTELPRYLNYVFYFIFYLFLFFFILFFFFVGLGGGGGGGGGLYVFEY